MTVSGTAFAAGDHVVIRRSDPRIGVVNGDRGTVAALEPGTGLLRVHLKTGRAVTLDEQFLSRTRAGLPAVQHGYAVTGHVAQGLTTDRTFVLGTDRLFREWDYVAMSRGRLSNRMYSVVGEPSDRDEFAPTRRRFRPLEDLVDRLERPDRQLTTTDEAYAAEFAAPSDPALRGQLTQLRVARLSDPTDPELRARVALAREELHRRAAVLGRAAALDAPGHLEQLGLVPDSPRGRRQWEGAAGAVEAYRLEFGVQDRRSPLGERPESPTQLVLWRDAQRELGRQRDSDRGISRD